MKFTSLLISSFLIFEVGTTEAWKYDEYISPDKIMIGRIIDAIWEDRQNVMLQAEEEFFIPFEDMECVLEKILKETEGYPDLAMTCAQCQSFVTTIKGFINRGLEFEDIRDFAIGVCNQITPGLGYDGDVICDGIIDVFGPHVYYVLNETDMGPREVCQFHLQCPSNNVSKINRRAAVPPIQNKQTPRRPRQSRKQMVKVAHLTDVHLDEKYAPGSPTECDLPICCRDYWNGTGEAGQWGTYGCALPLHTMNVMLRHYNEQGVSLVLNTGDSPNHALWEETQDGQIWQSQLLADAIKQYIPGVPAHLCVGNHDMYPTNQFYGPSPYIKDLLVRLGEMYQDLANFTAEQRATFEDGGYYISEILPGLKIMAYNTNYGFTDNYYGVLLQDTPDWSNMVDFMEFEFSIARENGDKIILLGHHPMGSGFDFWEEFINDIMMRYGDLTILHLMGHAHTDFYKMALDEEGNAVHVNSVTGAVMTQRNPTFKLYYIDTETLIPMEFDNYFINISRPVEDGDEPVVELMYNTFYDYGMEDLTAASYQEFTDRMEADDNLLNQFRWNEISRISDPGPCDDDCKRDFFCKRRTTSRSAYNECMQS